MNSTSRFHAREVNFDFIIERLIRARLFISPIAAMCFSAEADDARRQRDGDDGVLIPCLRFYRRPGELYRNYWAISAKLARPSSQFPRLFIEHIPRVPLRRASARRSLAQVEVAKQVNDRTSPHGPPIDTSLITIAFAARHYCAVMTSHLRA